MMTETLTIIGLLALPAWFVWLFFKGIRRGYSTKETRKPSTSIVGATPVKRPYILNAGPAPGLIDMPEATTRLLTYQDERHAATARQRLWIQYEDRACNTTERNIEIYHPEDDEYVFAWCCSKLEPRTFARRSICCWRLLPERFEFDPIIEQYWREEGTRDMSEKMPWRRWIDNQPEAIAQRYQHSEGLSLTYRLSTGQTQTSRMSDASPKGPRWWELRDEALLQYSKISGSTAADYQPVMQLIEQSIAAGASVSAQARLYRVLGEIHHSCGNNQQAIEHWERAIKLDPSIGIKKLLARLKADTIAP